MDDEPREESSLEKQGRAWLHKIEKYEKRLEIWRKQARKIVQRYRSQRSGSYEDSARFDHKFNLHWANVDMLQATVNARLPEPVVQRRWKDANPLGIESATILERALKFALQEYDFDDTLDMAVLDFANAGLGQGRVRYVPYFEERPVEIPVSAEDGPDEDLVYRYEDGREVETDREVLDRIDGSLFVLETEEIKVYEEVICDLVRWDRFGWCTDEGQWKKMPHAYIIHEMSKPEFTDAYGAEKAARAKFDAERDNVKQPSGQRHPRVEPTITVYEIYDKENREFLSLSEQYEGIVIEQEDDPWGLEGFYPFPKPLLSITTSDNMIPVPLFIVAQDLYDELDTVQARIIGLVDMLKVRGGYDQRLGTELAEILDAPEGELIPMDFSKLEMMPGSRDPVWIVEIQQIYQALQVLFEHRKQLKEEIYELYGFSDLLRGRTKASETAHAQDLKSQYTGLRFSRPGKKVQKFARDLIRIKGEMMAEHFDPETFQKVSQVPVTEEHMTVLRRQAVREYMIDIQTDSMMIENARQEVQDRMDFLTAVSQVIGQFIPALQLGVLGIEDVLQLVMFGARAFPKGRELESDLEQMITQAAQRQQMMANGGQQLPAPGAEGMDGAAPGEQAA